MIVKIHKSGFSFKDTAEYLAHDVKASTQERLGWTHTLNLANDHVGAAVSEMVWTARDAEALKVESGAHAGGRQTEKTVKHFSLNWAHGEDPSREHMIETAQSYLRHMNWQEHQAVIFCHTDKEHAHVHIMLNMIHPETGLRLNDSFERRRTQEWALAYEQENGRIHCPERLKDLSDREQSVPRNMWTEFRENEDRFNKDEAALRASAERPIEEPENARDSEWKILNQHQKQERIAFFANGKTEFSAVRNNVYRKVREEFREDWKDYYAARKSGLDAGLLSEAKERLTWHQKQKLKEMRDTAFSELREERKERYRAVLDGQQAARVALTWRQKAGLDNADFLQRQLEPRKIQGDFRNAANWVARPAMPENPKSAPIKGEPVDRVRADETGRVKLPSLRIASRARSFGGGILETLLNFDRVAPAPVSENADEPFRAAAEETVKATRQKARSREEDERAQRLSMLPREQQRG